MIRVIQARGVDGSKEWTRRHIIRQWKRGLAGVPLARQSGVQPSLFVQLTKAACMTYGQQTQTLAPKNPSKPCLMHSHLSQDISMVVSTGLISQNVRHSQKRPAGKHEAYQVESCLVHSHFGQNICVAVGACFISQDVGHG